MLTCKKCGAEMSGIDLVCKECGTPWGKTGKSKAPLFFSLILVCLFSFALLYFTNPELLGISKPVDNNIEQGQNKLNEEQPPVEQNPPIEELPPVTPEPPVEILPPVFTKAKASSSTKPVGAFTYTADKTTDGDNTTAWLEGAKGHGINEWIEFSADTEQYVNGFVLYNGYQKNEKTYINNGKVSKILITFSDGTTLEYELPKQNFKESQKGNTIKFTETKKTNSIRFTILDVEKGAYYEDTAINEIKFY
ncbi:MAG: hypothetical protein E7314_01930 [Clostridiales bacterium]|nr:hypothetical protein [Clostridiales bacterium]